jgi:hypothetical protein
MTTDKPLSWHQRHRHDFRPNVVKPVSPPVRKGRLRPIAEIERAHDTISRIIAAHRREEGFDPMNPDFAHNAGIMRTLCWVLDHKSKAADELTRHFDRYA